MENETSSLSKKQFAEWQKISAEIQQLMMQEDNERALKKAHEALAQAQMTLGPQHRLVAKALSIIAEIHRRLQQHHLSEKLHKSAIKMLEETAGAKDPYLATPLIMYAELLKDRQKIRQADTNLMRALALTEKAQDKHEQVLVKAECLKCIARLRAEQEKFDEAQPFLERALQILGGSTYISMH